MLGIEPGPATCKESSSQLYHISACSLKEVAGPISLVSLDCVFSVAQTVFENSQRNEEGDKALSGAMLSQESKAEATLGHNI